MKIEFTKEDIDDVLSELDKSARIKELEALCAAYRDALEFYGDPSSWSITEGHELRTLSSEDLETADEPTPWGAKGTFMAGKLAREALALPAPRTVQRISVLEDIAKAARGCFPDGVLEGFWGSRDLWSALAKLDALKEGE